jgi:hypothetical protein
MTDLRARGHTLRLVHSPGHHTLQCTTCGTSGPLCRVLSRHCAGPPVNVTPAPEKNSGLAEEAEAARSDEARTAGARPTARTRT